MCLVKPFAVAFDRAGRILVTDSGTDALIRFDVEGRRMDVLGTRGNVRLSKPLGLHVGPDDTIYVADAGLQAVVALDPEGTVVSVIGSRADLQNPTDAVLSPDGSRLYVTDSKAHQIVVFDPTNGRKLSTLGEPGEGEGQFGFPTSLVFGPDGSLFVVDQIHSRVQLFAEDGEYLDQFGGLGVGYGNFVRPKDVAVDEVGFIYVTDNAFNNVQLFDVDFSLLTFVGSGGTSPGRFHGASGIAVQGDRFAVVDQLGRRVQLFRFLLPKEADPEAPMDVEAVGAQRSRSEPPDRGRAPEPAARPGPTPAREPETPEPKVRESQTREAQTSQPRAPEPQTPELRPPEPPPSPTRQKSPTATQPSPKQTATAATPPQPLAATIEPAAAPPAAVPVVDVEPSPPSARLASRRRMNTAGAPPSASRSSATSRAVQKVLLATQIGDVVRGWAAAWAGQRVEDYLSFYADNFVPSPGGDHGEWVDQRRRRLSRPAFIEVTVARLTVGEVGSSLVRASFEQSYRSSTYQDRVRKILDMELQDGVWKIVAERSESL
jgi:hypothetical protein